MLRVSAVRLLAMLCEAKPELLGAVRPEVWSSLVRWFAEQRCNHIFQAVCGSLFICVIKHGTDRLQNHILVRLGLLKYLCDVVLEDRQSLHEWHDVQAELCSSVSSTEEA